MHWAGAGMIFRRSETTCKDAFGESLDKRFYAECEASDFDGVLAAYIRENAALFEK